MKISEIESCFYVPGVPGIIDAVHPKTGLGVYSGESLEQIRKRDPGAELGNFEQVCDQQDAYWRKPPVEITRDRFLEMLGVLPPVGWEMTEEEEVFKLAERTSGAITAIFCRIGDRYFEMQDRIYLDVDLIVAKCKAVM